MTRQRKEKFGAWAVIVWLLAMFGLMLGCLAVPMHAQTSNTFNVYQFRNNAASGTVGEMTTAAQAACNATLNCIIIFDPILNAYPAGNMPARCANCSWIDYRVPGSYTVTPANVKNQNNVRWADQFAGADIGAQINAAYADLSTPATCGVGTIYLSPKADGSAYNFSTPIVLNTAGKLVRLAGYGGPVTINYTPTSGTAITLDYYSAANCPNGHFTGHGLSDIRLLNNGGAAPVGGPGSNTAVGLLLGTTNGSEGTKLDADVFDSFNVGISNPGTGVSGWNMKCYGCILVRNGTGYQDTTSGNVIENTAFFGGEIINNGTGISHAAGDLFLYGVSMDSNSTIGLTATGGNVHGSGNHWENFNVSTSHYIQSTGGFVSLNGDSFVDDTTTSNTDWLINLNGGLGSFNSISFNSGGRTATQLIQINQPSTLSGSIINGSGSVYTVPFGGSSVSPILTPSGVCVTVLGRSNDPATANQSVCGNTQQVNRIKANQGTALVVADFAALAGGWGNTASKSAITGFDAAGSLTVASAGTGQAANPAVVLTFHDGTWTNAPTCTASRGDALAPLGALSVTSTATTMTITFQGTPVAATSYVLSWGCTGR